VTALGSTLVVKLLCDQPIFAPEFGIYSHRIGSAWLAGDASNTGGKVVERFFPRDRLAALSEALKPKTPTGPKYYPLLRPGEPFRSTTPSLRQGSSPGQKTTRPSFRRSWKASPTSRRGSIASSRSSARPRCVPSEVSAPGP
jgi:D-ribulokinase